MNRQVLIISFWNPTEKHPQQGIFIQDQAAAVCSLRDDIVFLRINVLPSKNLILKKEILDSQFFRNRQITINLYSLFWKFYFVNPWLMARIIKKILTQKFPEIKPALIHSNVIFPCGIVAWLLAKKTDSKMIISEHWSKAEKLIKHPLYRKTALKAYLKNSTVITVSEFLASIIAGSTGHKNIKVIPNIVNTALFSYKQKTYPDKNSIICTCVATWKPPKRLDLIVDSLVMFVLETGYKVNLNIIGNGIQTESAKAGKVPENLNIVWHGYLTKEAIVPLLHRSHIFLHASEIETFSIVTAEALSTGTPVLASDRGALPELIHKHNGMLAENDVVSWKEKLCEIINNRFDNEVIARENQARFSPENVGRTILEVYNKVLNEYNNPD
ncbi:MAG TPA: glycosyltransferase family 4 protein [Bacteroidales bacterium]|nr:glycosyltransferase family 4 protein [Bacteroidales bacterium]